MPKKKKYIPNKDDDFDIEKFRESQKDMREKNKRISEKYKKWWDKDKKTWKPNFPGHGDVKDE